MKSYFYSKPVPVLYQLKEYVCYSELNLIQNNNLLLTEREGRTGEYWPEVVAVQTERTSSTKTTEGQYSTVLLEQARLVSSLLYGTLSLIVKCNSGVFSIYL